jgi:hypothetical protein
MNMKLSTKSVLTGALILTVQVISFAVKAGETTTVYCDSSNQETCRGITAGGVGYSAQGVPHTHEI